METIIDFSILALGYSKLKPKERSVLFRVLQTQLRTPERRATILRDLHDLDSSVFTTGEEIAEYNLALAKAYLFEYDFSGEAMLLKRAEDCINLANRPSDVGLSCLMDKIRPEHFYYRSYILLRRAQVVEDLRDSKMIQSLLTAYDGLSWTPYNALISRIAYVLEVSLPKHGILSEDEVYFYRKRIVGK